MRPIRARAVALGAAALVVAVLALFSMATGASGGLWTVPADIVWITRWPRTAALLISGAATAIAGLIIQHLTQNRFVEPGNAGTVPAAGLGLLATTILWPEAPVVVRMLIAILAALAGTGLFLALVSRLPLRSPLLVPLVGIMLGAVISAVTTFVAIRFEMLQSLVGWLSGDFSAVLRGRYELIWAGGGVAILAYGVADRLAVAGLGRDAAVNLGLNYRLTLVLGLALVAAVNGVITAIVGALPFVGLIVPNLVRMLVGDHPRRAIPWIALLGGGLVLACDLVGRLVRYPYEIPAGAILGVAGATAFLAVLWWEPGDGRA